MKPFASSRSLLVAAFSTLAVALVPGCSGDAAGEDTTQTDDALTAGRIVVSHFDSPGARVSKWGYDIKQGGKAHALDASLAGEIFVDIGMNMLRVAVRAAEAHPAAGQVDGSKYADDVDAIGRVKAKKPSVDVFASLKLEGTDTFPGWVKNADGVDPDRYAVLLEDYLAFVHARGITIDWLGVDNESRWNEGHITPAKYNRIVDDVRHWCTNHGLKVPGFIAAENYGPSDDLPWVETLWGLPKQFDDADHVGVHIYSKLRTASYVSEMHALADDVHGKGLWDSEFHWSDLAGDGIQFDDIKQGMLSAFDHFDMGFHGISWWAFEPRSAKTKAGYIMSELVSTTVDGSVLATDDRDGGSPALGKFNTRAFRTGAHEVTLWVGNFTDVDRPGQWTEISNQKVTGVSYLQWSPFSPAAGVTGHGHVIDGNRACFAAPYPANTITRVRVTLE